MVSHTELEFDVLQVNQRLNDLSECLQTYQNTNNVESLNNFKEILSLLAKHNFAKLQGLQAIIEEINLSIDFLFKRITKEQQEACFTVCAKILNLCPHYFQFLGTGQPDNVFRWLPLMNELRQIRGEACFTRSHYWVKDIAVLKVGQDAPGLLQDIPKCRSEFGRLLLSLLKGETGDTLYNELLVLIRQLKNSFTEIDSIALWWSAEAFVLALQEGALQLTPEAKRVFSRLEREIQRYQQGLEAYQKNVSADCALQISRLLEPYEGDHEVIHQVKSALHIRDLFAESPFGEAEVATIAHHQARLALTAQVNTEIIGLHEALDLFARGSEYASTHVQEQLPHMEHLHKIAQLLDLTEIQTLITTEIQTMTDVTQNRIAVGDPRVNTATADVMQIAALFQSWAAESLENRRVEK